VARLLRYNRALRTVLLVPALLLVAVPARADGTVREATFHSDALGVDKHYLVYLPTGYDAAPQKRYPVIYMLHGLGGTERNWVENGHIDKAADKLGLQAIIVMPDGDASFYADSVTPADYDACMHADRMPFLEPTLPRDGYCVKHASYETYIVKDLIGHVDGTYRTVAEKKGRAIGGLSMGGFGALQLALRHKDLFALVASHSGLDALLYVGPRPYVKGQAKLADDVPAFVAKAGKFGVYFEQLFGKDIAGWRAHDPASLVATLKPGELAIYLDAGMEDDLGLDAGAAYLHDLLEARGIPHEWALVHGHHNFALWQERVPESLRFHAEQFHKAGLY
jgi:S-formylglutathione hydrolase FrmB